MNSFSSSLTCENKTVLSAMMVVCLVTKFVHLGGDGGGGVGGGGLHRSETGTGDFQI